MSDTGWVLLARLVRPQGRKGEIIAEIFTDFPELFAQRPRVFLTRASENAAGPAREVFVERHRPHQGRIVFKFRGVDSINDAEPLRGLEVVVPAEERAPLVDDAVYIGDLIGCKVIDIAAGTEILAGEIMDVERGVRGAPDLLVVRPTARPAATIAGPDAKDAVRPRRGKRAPKPADLLVPFVKSYLVSIDVEKKRVVMRLPDGLTGLNMAAPETGAGNGLEGEA